MGAWSIDVRFYRLSEALQPYFTALYSFDIDARRVGGGLVEDYLHPEWATMRFSCGEPPAAVIGAGPLAPQWPFVVSGPTSRAVRFGLSNTRIWGLGLLPAGWGRYVPASAHLFADRTLDGAASPAFTCFAPLHGLVEGAGGEGRDSTAGRINDYLMGLQPLPNRQEAAIIACHEASCDPDICNVAQLAERTGLQPRSLERLCKRYFGFPPKMVLRRQRFLRSLAQFMSGRRSWSESLDRQYFDQAHFVRDFRSFMGMTPSEYAEMPHPVFDRIIVQRLADQGAAPQTDLPTVLRYSGADEARRARAGD